MTKKLMVAGVLYVVWAAPVFADKEVVFSNCLLKVKGVTYIKGSCAGSLGSEGSFQIRNKLYNADIDPAAAEQANTALGSWDAQVDETNVHDDLGELTREGACWKNTRATICAWK